MHAGAAWQSMVFVSLVSLQLGVATVVIRLGRVPFMDATGLNTLNEIAGRLQKRHVRVLLCGIHPALRESLDASGTTALVGTDNICSSMGEVATKVSAASGSK